MLYYEEVLVLFFCRMRSANLHVGIPDIFVISSIGVIKSGVNPNAEKWSMTDDNVTYAWDFVVYIVGDGSVW